MKNLRRLLLVFIFISTFTSCAWFEENENEQIIGSYSLSRIDSQGTKVTKGVNENGGLYTTVIDSDVISVGHSGKFIFAKQKERFSSDTLTNYYIIDTIKNVSKKEGVYGPLTKNKFDSLITKLKIQYVMFGIKYTKNK